MIRRLTSSHGRQRQGRPRASRGLTASPMATCHGPRRLAPYTSYQALRRRPSRSRSALAPVFLPTVRCSGCPRVIVPAPRPHPAPLAPCTGLFQSRKLSKRANYGIHSPGPIYEPYSDFGRVPPVPRSLYQSNARAQSPGPDDARGVASRTSVELARGPSLTWPYACACSHPAAQLGDIPEEAGDAEDAANAHDRQQQRQWPLVARLRRHAAVDAMCVQCVVLRRQGQARLMCAIARVHMYMW